jgi:hypothetical protein
MPFVARLVHTSEDGRELYEVETASVNRETERLSFTAREGDETEPLVCQLVEEDRHLRLQIDLDHSCPEVGILINTIKMEDFDREDLPHLNAYVLANGNIETGVLLVAKPPVIVVGRDGIYRKYEGHARPVDGITITMESITIN